MFAWAVWSGTKEREADVRVSLLFLSLIKHWSQIPSRHSRPLRQRRVGPGAVHAHRIEKGMKMEKIERASEQRGWMIYLSNFGRIRAGSRVPPPIHAGNRAEIRLIS